MGRWEACPFDYYGFPRDGIGDERADNGQDPSSVAVALTAAADGTVRADQGHHRGVASGRSAPVEDRQPEPLPRPRLGSPSPAT